MSKLEVLKAMVEKYTGVESEADNQTEAMIELLLAELGGGSEPLIVEITGSGSEVICNVTADEIVEAVNAGRIIRFRGPDSIMGYPCVCTMKEAGQFGLENKVMLTFSITHSDTSGTYNHVYVIMGSNVTHYETFKVARG